MKNQPQFLEERIDQKVVKTLTEWKNEPSVGDLRGDLDIAKPHHDEHVTKVNRWLDLRNVKGTAKPKGKDNSTRSQVQPKLVRRQAEWRYSALSEPFLSNHRLFKVTGRTFEDVKSARQQGILLNWQFRTKLNRTKFIDEYVRVTVDEGTCVVRLGWERETVKEEVEVPVYQYSRETRPEWLEHLAKVGQLQKSDPHGYKKLPPETRASFEYSMEKGVPAIASQVGTTTEMQERTVVNQPTLDILHYENVFLDPSCNGNVDKAKFVVISFETSYSELKKDGRYHNLEAVDWEAASPLSEPTHASQIDESMQFKDKARKRVVAYEYWGWYDIHGDGILVPIVATWVGSTMIRMEENPFPDRKLPIVVVNYMPVTRSVTGEPDAELLEENQQILGALTRGVIDLMGRSANSQTGHAKGMLDPVNLKRYREGNDYEFNPNIHPTEGIHQHKYPEIPQSALTMMGVQNQEAEALSGVKAFSGGLSGEAYGEVAAGIRGMLDASSKREMAILRRLAQGLQQMGSKIAAMNAVFLDEEEVVRVTNEEYVTVLREDLAGDYDLEVDISTAEVDEAKSSDLSFMLQTLGNSVSWDVTKLILAEIARLKRMPELAERVENYQPAPDPITEELKKLELMKLQKEIEELDSKIALNMSKAREASSKSDKADLDFIEQETGTQHARDIDKQRAQGEANADAEIIKGILSRGEGGPTNQNLRDAATYRNVANALTDI